jgi:hypothetical protein
MAEHSQELKVVLQTLGLPVSGQVRLMADDCTRVAILSGAFASASRTVRGEAGSSLTAQQRLLLAELDRRLEALCQQSCAPLGSELDLRQSASWRRVRRTAREALCQFGWTLEIPARDVRVGSSYPSSQIARRQQDDCI